MKTDTYHKTKLISILQNTKWKQNDSANAKGTYFLNYITKFHIFEKMIDSEGYLYPRGYDLLVNVLIPGEQAAKLCGAQSNMDYLQCYHVYDIRWLSNWVAAAEEQTKIPFQPYPTTDLKVMEFKRAWLFNESARFDSWLSKHPKFKKTYVYKKENQNWITQEGLQAYLETWNLGDQVRRMSLFVAEHYASLRQEISMISNNRHHKERYRLRAVDKEFLKLTGQSFYDLQAYYGKAGAMKSEILRTLVQNHPHEKWVYRQVAEQKGKVGHLVVPFVGVNWFQTVFLPYHTKGQILVQKDIEWTRMTMQRLNIIEPSVRAMTPHEFQNVYTLEKDIAWYFYQKHCPQVLDNEGALIPEAVIQEMEQQYPLLYLRRLSFVCSPVTSVQSKPQMPEATDKRKKNQTYMDVQELRDRQIYKGKIIYRTNTTQDRVNKIPLRRIPVELEDHRKVKLLIPEWILEGHYQRLFLLQHAPIQFRLEKTKEGHKRVAWFDLFDGISLQLDWSRAAIDHVKVSKGVKTQKRESFAKKEKKKYFALRFTPDEYEFLCQYQKKWQLPTLVFLTNTLIDRFLFEERKLDHLQQLKEQAQVHQKELEEFERNELGLSDKAYSMIHGNLLERNQSFEKYITQYDKLFCQGSNLTFRKPVKNPNQNRTVLKSLYLPKETVKIVFQILNTFHYANVRDWILASLVDLPEPKLWIYKNMLDVDRNASYHLSRGLLT